MADSAEAIFQVANVLREKFTVVGLKNGFRAGPSKSPSGYRDLKMLVVAEIPAEMMAKLEIDKFGPDFVPHWTAGPFASGRPMIFRDGMKTFDWDSPLKKQVKSSPMKMICEVQLVLNAYEHLKKETSFGYKLRRADKWQGVLEDFKKYLYVGQGGMESKYKDQGWKDS